MPDARRLCMGQKIGFSLQSSSTASSVCYVFFFFWRIHLPPRQIDGSMLGSGVLACEPMVPEAQQLGTGGALRAQERRSKMA